MKHGIMMLCLMAINLSTFAQNPAAIKVDEYVGRRGSNESVVEKTQTFLSKAKSEKPGTRVAIIFYDHGQIEGDGITSTVVADKSVQNLVRKLVGVDSELDPSLVIFIQGGLTLSSRVEYWLIPQGAELPKIVDYEPHFGCVCMNLSVFGPANVDGSTKRIKFFAWLGNGLKDSRIKYNWTLSAGKLVTGQGTDEIQVEIPHGVNGITANLEISGIDPSCNCPTMASHTTVITARKP